MVCSIHCLTSNVPAVIPLSQYDHIPASAACRHTATTTGTPERGPPPPRPAAPPPAMVLRQTLALRQTLPSPRRAVAEEPRVQVRSDDALSSDRGCHPLRARICVRFLFLTRQNPLWALLTVLANIRCELDQVQTNLFSFLMNTMLGWL